MLSAVEYLFQSDIRIALSEHVLLQFEFAVLDGRDGDAVDVADGAVAEAEPREDTQADVVFLHSGVLFANLGKAVTVDGVERTFYLAPFVRTEVDDRIATLVKLLQRFRALPLAVVGVSPVLS